jgi:hypothetical protein
MQAGKAETFMGTCPYRGSQLEFAEVEKVLGWQGRGRAGEPLVSGKLVQRRCSVVALPGSTSSPPFPREVPCVALL